MKTHAPRFTKVSIKNSKGDVYVGNLLYPCGIELARSKELGNMQGTVLTITLRLDSKNYDRISTGFFNGTERLELIR